MIKICKIKYNYPYINVIILFVLKSFSNSCTVILLLYSGCLLIGPGKIYNYFGEGYLQPPLVKSLLEKNVYPTKTFLESRMESGKSTPPPMKKL